MEKKPKKRIGVMDVILIVVAASLFAFTVCMIEIYKAYGSVPDTLVTCVFAALGGECGIMGMIKSFKLKYKEREWQNEDMERLKREQAAPVDEDKSPADEHPRCDL